MTIQSRLSALATSTTRLLAGWCFVLAVTGCAPAFAQVVITPVLLELGPRQRAVTVSVTLDEKAPAAMLLQSEMLRWSQQIDGLPALEPADDLLVAPAIAELKPGKTQLFRVALARPRESADEASYRLILEDAAEPLPQKDPESGMSIKFRMRYDLPVFVLPSAPLRTALRWQRCDAVAGKACIGLVNEGNRHVRLNKLIVAAGGEQKDAMAAPTTVLSGATRQWFVDLPTAVAASLSIQAETTTGSVTAQLPAPAR